MNMFIDAPCENAIANFTFWYNINYKKNYDAIIYFTRNYFNDCHG